MQGGGLMVHTHGSVHSQIAGEGSAWRRLLGLCIAARLGQAALWSQVDQSNSSPEAALDTRSDQGGPWTGGDFTVAGLPKGLEQPGPLQSLLAASGP